MFANRSPDPAAFPPSYHRRTDPQYMIVFGHSDHRLAAGFFPAYRAGYAVIVGLLTVILAAVLSAPMAAVSLAGTVPAPLFGRGVPR